MRLGRLADHERNVQMDRAWQVSVLISLMCSARFAAGDCQPVWDWLRWEGEGEHLVPYLGFSPPPVWHPKTPTGPKLGPQRQVSSELVNSFRGFSGCGTANQRLSVKVVSEIHPEGSGALPVFLTNYNSNRPGQGSLLLGAALTKIL